MIAAGIAYVALVIAIIVLYSEHKPSKKLINKVPYIEKTIDLMEDIGSNIIKPFKKKKYTQVVAPKPINQGKLRIGLGTESEVALFTGDYKPYSQSSVESKYINLKIKWKSPQAGDFGLYKADDPDTTTQREEGNQYTIKIFAKPSKNNENFSSFDKGLLVLEFTGTLGDKGWKYKGYQTAFDKDVDKEAYQRNFDGQETKEISIDNFNNTFFCAHTKVNEPACNKDVELQLQGSEFGQYFHSDDKTIYDVMIYVTHSNIDKITRDEIEKTTQIASFEWDPKLIEMKDIPASNLKSFNAFMLIDAANLLRNQALMYKRIDPEKEGYIIINDSDDTKLIKNGKLNTEHIWDGHYVFTFYLQYDTSGAPFGYLMSGGKYLKANFRHNKYSLVNTAEDATRIKALMEQRDNKEQKRTIILEDKDTPLNKGKFELNFQIDENIGKRFNSKGANVCWEPSGASEYQKLKCGISTTGIGASIAHSNILNDRINWTIVDKNKLKDAAYKNNFKVVSIKIELIQNPAFQEGDNEAEIKIILNPDAGSDEKIVKGFYDGNLFYFKHNNTRFFGRSKHIHTGSRWENRLQIINESEKNGNYVEYRLV